MHEVPNLHPGVIRFGQRLVDEGFRVWMPSLMGVPGRPVSVRTSLRSIGRACVSREFATWALGRTSPITVWLRALARHAGEGRPVGAIGMCLTGGFALAMAVDDVLAAPVLSQPSVPFALSPWHARDLGVSDEDLGTLRRRCADEGLCVLGLRFSMDAMAPGARFRRLREELGDAFLAVEIDSSLGNPHGIPPWHHSVLAHHYVDRPDHPTRQAEDRVVAFFRERLTADR
ncbi:MAG: dienelactone hydrolase [Alphaproteobacteria bacterium]|nr:dienelactone hydrolase [Alphaproteobacteria bacterium]MCB9698923.1 dienelactone hydrolase [Alphaproteobacteria bacterium]